MKKEEEKELQLGLKHKLTMTMLAVGIFPLLFGSVLSYIEGNRSLQSILGSSFQALAFQSATQIDFLINEEIAKNLSAAKNPVIVDSVARQNAFIKSLPEAERKPWITVAEEDWRRSGAPPEPLFYDAVYPTLQIFWKEHLRSLESTQTIFVTDRQGLLVSSINTYIDFVPAVPPSLKEVVNRGETFLSEVYVDSFGQHVFHIAVPVISNLEVIGAFHRIYSAKKYFGPVLEAVRFGKTGHVMMIDSRGVVIDCPILPTGFRLPVSKLVKQVTGPEPGWIGAHDDGHGNLEFSIIGSSPVHQINETIKTSRAFPWHVMAWQSSEELFEPARKLVNWSAGIGATSVLLVVFLGAFASNKIVKPVQHLQEAAAKIGKGHLNEEVKIESGDEIGKLAGSFNRMIADLRASRLSEQQQTEQFRKFFRAVEQSPTSVLITNIEGIIEYVNPTFCRTAGYKLEEIVGHKPSILKSGFHPDSFYKKLWETILSGKTWRGEFCNRRKDGQQIWELQSISPLRNADGNTTHFVAVKIDDTERKRAEKELKFYTKELEQSLKTKENLIQELEDLKKRLEISSRTDPMTKLLNRRGFEEKLDYVKILFDRHQKSFSLALADVDHFKRVNDTYGHDAGDYVLVEIAKLLESTCRHQDIPCRWGGEEFLILLPETNLEGARILAEKLRATVEKKPFKHHDKIIPVTLSIGLSIFDKKNMPLGDCIKKADECLYDAKRLGRNRVICPSDGNGA